MSAKLLRIAAPAIADSLCKLINFCIEKQTFPTKWKVGKVTPIYKGQGNRDDKNNYRPITVLPILSKLLEKHICDHLCDFLEENALLHRFQSGFRKFHSTETALIHLVDQLLFDLNKNRASGLVWGTRKRAGITTQLSKWTHTVCTHQWLSFLPKNCVGWSTAREYFGPHFVSFIH